MASRPAASHPQPNAPRFIYPTTCHPELYSFFYYLEENGLIIPTIYIVFPYLSKAPLENTSWFNWSRYPMSISRQASLDLSRMMMISSTRVCLSLIARLSAPLS